MRVGLKKKKKKDNIKTYNWPDLAPARERGQRQRSEGGWVENLRGGFLKINVMNTVSVCLLERNVLVPTYFDISLHTVSGLPLFYIYIYIYIYIIDKKIHIINIEGFKVISI